jgi:hypothetical protein
MVEGISSAKRPSTATACFMARSQGLERALDDMVAVFAGKLAQVYRSAQRP